MKMTSRRQMVYDKIYEIEKTELAEDRAIRGNRFAQDRKSVV